MIKPEPILDRLTVELKIFAALAGSARERRAALFTAARGHLGLSQRDLAVKMGMPLGHIIAKELGQISIREWDVQALYSLCKAHATKEGTAAVEPTGKDDGAGRSS